MITNERLSVTTYYSSYVIMTPVQEGFRYHHAEQSYLMLTYWIPDDEPCLLPANASHQVGVGGFVINNQMEVNLSRANAFSIDRCVP